MTLISRKTVCDACADRLRGIASAISAPQPAADERVKELMKAVDVLVETVYAETLAKERGGQGADITEAQAYEAVESSARALLAAEREDAQMLDWMIDQKATFGWSVCGDEWTAFIVPLGFVGFPGKADRHKDLREAIRAAMQKGTP